jgi:hypothetical protein
MPRLNLFRNDPIVWRTFAFYAAVVVYSLTAALVIGREERTSAVVPILAFVAVLAVIVVVPHGCPCFPRVAEQASAAIDDPTAPKRERSGFMPELLGLCSSNPAVGAR